MTVRDRIHRIANEYVIQRASKTVNVDVYNHITEGRNDVPGMATYSWCGDFCSCVLMEAGVRDPAIINRVAVRGKWTPGHNISDVLTWAQNNGALRKRVSDAELGDYLYFETGRGGHVGIFEQFNADRSIVTSLDGNAGVDACTARRTRYVNGGMPLKYVVDVSKLPYDGSSIGESVPNPIEELVEQIDRMKGSGPVDILDQINQMLPQVLPGFEVPELPFDVSAPNEVGLVEMAEGGDGPEPPTITEEPKPGS
jgi:hypothetical protein